MKQKQYNQLLPQSLCVNGSDHGGRVQEGAGPPQQDPLQGFGSRGTRPPVLGVWGSFSTVSRANSNMKIPLYKSQ